jgi:general secretion pathway protein K
MVARLNALSGGERGVALIAVLAFLAAMALIAAGVVGAARSAATSASRALLRAQAQAAVESGIDYAIAELVNARGFAPALVEKPETVELGGYRVTVSVRPEHAKVDLNHADAHLLAILFRAGGAAPDRAARLADAVEDWRDGDSLVRVNGAELPQYAEAGLSYGPANRPFSSADELKLVLGVAGAIYDCVRPQVTVLAQRGGIDLDNAAASIREASGADAGAPRAQTTINGGDAFEITAELDDRARGIKRAERAVVRITGNPDDPYWALAVEPARPIDEAAARSCPKK